MTSGRSTKAVRDQYEAYPFPVRRPEDEEQRLIASPIDQLARIDHYCFSGRRDFHRPLRALIAGGGTGDALIYLAEQLRGKPCEFVYLDLCANSMAIARERAEVRGVERVTWIEGSLADLDDLGLGEFDYVNCVGVLHHLDNPRRALDRLAASLAPEGGLGIMLYGRYGRRSVYLLREALGFLTEEGEDLPARVQVTRRVLTDLSHNRVVGCTPSARHMLDTPEGDAYLVDTYLHECDHPYTVPEIHRLLESCGLHLSGFTSFFELEGAVMPLEYDPSLYFTDPDVLERLTRLSLPDAQHLAEILNGGISMHAFYATRRAGSAAQVSDLDNAPYFPTSYAAEAARSILEQGLERVEVRLRGGLKRSFELSPLPRAILGLIDGRTSIGEMTKIASAGTSELSLERCVQEVLAFLDLMVGLGLVLLRNAARDPLPLLPSQRSWTGSLDLT